MTFPHLAQSMVDAGANCGYCAAGARRADIGDVDALTATTEAIHEAGLVPERWPDALASISRFLDARFATLEVLDRASFEHLSFQASQLPPGNMDAYLGHYAAINPRALHAR